MTLDGSSGLISSSQQVSNPTVYSEELWFNTVTTQGGKLIGFGSSQTGSSGSYDRHVYMVNSGQLTFGVWTGQTNTITSAKSYNDGQWHHLVATQGPDGMALYVDGQSVGTNPQNQAQGYTGYWRVGGDNTWGGASSNYFAGVVDEAAIYSSELTPAQVLAHYRASGAAVNNPPTAAFTPTCTNLSCGVDGSASSDSDGTVASYAWSFGDGGTATGATATHAYAAAGQYTITLTVTDNQGATGSTTKQVTVNTPPPNVPPTAAFTPTCTNLSCGVDGSASSDSDGTVASYAWSFGDGGTGTGATATHAYATAGQYTITLTVTDNQGATGSTTKQITVTPPPNVPPTAAFTPTCTNLSCSVDGSASSDSDGTVASYAWDFGDGGTGTGATATHVYATAGQYTITLTVTDNQGATNAVTHTVAVLANVPPTAAFTPTCTNLSCSVDGSASSDSDGTVASYAWNFGDGGTATGATATHAYTSPGQFTISLTVTDNQGATNAVTHTVTVSGNVAPTAAFTPTCTNLSCSVDGSASSDSDGTVASYAWDFGDGGTATGATATHAYATAGDYTITLTVTDNQGATGKVTHVVSPRPPANPSGVSFAGDAFGRTTTNGWGTADTGGAWTAMTTPSNMATTPGTATQTLTAAAASVGAYLGSVAVTDADVRTTISVDKLSAGNGDYVYVLGRRTAKNVEYRALVRILPTGAVRISITQVKQHQ